MTFAQLNLNKPLLKAITQGGYTEATPIQAEAIPHILNGKDMLGSAQTGTGKTAAFALPIIQRIQETTVPSRRKAPRALILAPTRELALQIKENFHTYSKNSPLKTAAIYGGVPKRRQIQTLKRGVDIIVATPGRLLDLMEMGILSLSTIDFYVLDEADRMLDMGFIPDVKKITGALPSKHQTMLFSATLPKSILNLSKALLQDPVRVEVAKDNAPLETINQAVYFVNKSDKPALLSDVLNETAVKSALVFVRTRQGANRLTKNLNGSGLNVDAIHGDKSQSQRQQTLRNFKLGKTQVLIATDVASRGIDIDALSHVINYDLPETPEAYLHRIGRTARAGRLGSSLSFCSSEETHLLKAIQKHIGMTVPVEGNHRFKLERTPRTQDGSNPKHKKKRKNPDFGKRRKYAFKPTSKRKNTYKNPAYSQR